MVERTFTYWNTWGPVWPRFPWGPFTSTRSWFSNDPTDSLKSWRTLYRQSIIISVWKLTAKLRYNVNERADCVLTHGPSVPWCPWSPWRPCREVTHLFYNGNKWNLLYFSIALWEIELHWIFFEKWYIPGILADLFLLLDQGDPKKHT